MPDASVTELPRICAYELRGATSSFVGNDCKRQGRSSSQPGRQRRPSDQQTRIRGAPAVHVEPAAPLPDLCIFGGKWDKANG
jgi:hypothetical protein